MKEYIINENVLASTIQYLATKPYKEVFELITALQGCKPVIDEKDVKFQSED